MMDISIQDRLINTSTGIGHFEKSEKEWRGVGESRSKRGEVSRSLPGVVWGCAGKRGGWRMRDCGEWIGASPATRVRGTQFGSTEGA